MIPHSKPVMGEEEVEAAARVLRSGCLAQGPEVDALEVECAALVGRRYAVAVNSGSAALHLALIALGVTPGDAVGMPAYVCAALLQAARWQGARPVLGDVDRHGNLRADADLSACRAVMAPHLFGKRVALPKHGAVIEDVAQSLGGSTGREGVAAIGSFYATKLVAAGEGGILLTDDADLAACARDRRDYDNREVDAVRYAYKLTDVQAAVARVQLRRLPGFLARRREIAAAYAEAFHGLPLELPDPADHVFFRYVIATDRRDALEAHLHAQGVDAKRPVFRPLHHYIGGDYPGADRAHREFLSIPIYPALTDAEQAHVIESMRRFFEI